MMVISGPGGTPFCKLYRYVSPHWVGFLRRLGLKTGIHFAHFGLESGMVFEGTTGVCERINRMRIRNGFEEFVCFRTNLSNDDI